jgi:hypothetical protein
MQKIDKSQILSTNYKTWHNSLGDNHPTYNSSNNKYYNEIKMCLLHCQKGLCAYTEEMLCDEKYFDISNWQNGKYTPLTQIQKNEIQGDLEHFDESLKTQKAWLWDNLFIVDTYINCRVKHTKAIKNILKPDSSTYDPYKYLDFNYETGVFFPNINLTQQEKDDVAYMIEVLGINCFFSQRKKQLQEWKDRIDVGLNVQPYRFITAWNMTLSKKT